MSNEPVKPIKLTLIDDDHAVGDHQRGAENQDQSGARDRGHPGQKQPSDAGSLFDEKLIVAYCAIAFGFLGIFTSSVIFVPLCVICSFVALFQGHGSWAFVGFLLAIGGFVTSPLFMGLLGFGTMGLWLMSLG